MLLGNYGVVQLIAIAIEAIFIQNILLFNFLGMCSYLACSGSIKTATGLGRAVFVIMSISGAANWCVREFVTKGALGYLSFLGFDASSIDLGFLEFLIFISVIAAITQMLEILLERFSPTLSRSLGIFLPLITVNCAILGACLFAVVRNYPFIPCVIYMASSGLGWWLAIVILAAIRQKISGSNVVEGLRGMGITFIISGLISLSFLGFAGISLSAAREEIPPPITQAD